MSLLMGAIMFGIGLNLRFIDFSRVFLYPKAIFIGLTGQMLILPLVAGIISWIWPMEAAFKVALVLIASCPGGISSNLLTYMNNGRVALSVSLTAINSFLILFTIPFFMDLANYIFMGKGAHLELSFADTFKNLFINAVLPVFAGLIVNEFTKGRYTKKYRKPFQYIMLLFLFIIFILALFVNREGTSFNLGRYVPLVLPALLLNIAVTFGGYWYSGLSGLKLNGRYTIAIEMGLQNNALAIFIATQLLQDEKMALMALVYSSFSFFTTWWFIYLLRRRAKEEDQRT